MKSSDAIMFPDTREAIHHTPASDSCARGCKRVTAFRSMLHLSLRGQSYCTLQPTASGAAPHVERDPTIDLGLD